MRLTLFGKRGCGPCLALEAHLVRYGIAYDKQNVEANAGAKEFVMKRFSGVPVLWDNDTDRGFVGYNIKRPERLEDWLKEVGWKSN